MRATAVDEGNTGQQLLSEELSGWLGDEDARTLGSLLDLFGARGFAVAFVVLLALPALPLPTGGATHVFELVAVLLASQMVVGRREMWLPQRWRRQELAGERSQQLIAGIVRLVRRLESLPRPHVPFLLDNRPGEIVFGLLVICGSVGAFLAPPFTGLDTLPALGVVVLSVGMLLEDMVLSAVGAAIEVAGIALIFALGGAVLTAIDRFF